MTDRTLDALRRAGQPDPAYLPNAVGPEDLTIELIAGSDAEVAGVVLGDHVGRSWLYRPVSLEEMRKHAPDAGGTAPDDSRQRRAPGTLAARRILVERLVEALWTTQQELELLSGCQVTDDPDVPARLPAEFQAVFWRADARSVLSAAERALAAAEAAGFTAPVSRTRGAR